MQPRVLPRQVDPHLEATISEGFHFRDIPWIARDLIWAVPILVLVAVGILLFVIPVALYGVLERLFKFTKFYWGKG